MPEGVHAAPTGSPGHLLELVRIRTRRRRPSHLLMRPITTERAGMLTPSARVSVAKTTCIKPRAEEHFDELLQHRQQPGVVEPDALARKRGR